MGHTTPLLVVGAGPFGLAMSAWARRLGIEHVLLGRPMAFWRENMPDGMLLRSACDWHLDPSEELTLERYLELHGRVPADVEPLTLALYLSYADWFQRTSGIETVPRLVHRLELDETTDTFRARLDDGGSIDARTVVLAPGFRSFAHVPPERARMLPEDRYEHTCDRVALADLRGKRVLVVGGRQSAFEWAALLREAGAAGVHVVYRHPTPRFETSDWSWVDQVILATGYRVSIDRLPYLHAGGLLPRIETVDGSPVLDESLQTTVPGLFITSIPATRDFGAFFAFTVSVRASAKIIGRALVRGAFQRAGAVP